MLSEINAFIQCSVSCRSSSVNRLSSNQTKTSKMVHHFSAFSFCCCFLFVCLNWRYAADDHTIEFIILRIYTNFLYHQPKLLCLLPWQKKGRNMVHYTVITSYITAEMSNTAVNGVGARFKHHYIKTCHVLLTSMWSKRQHSLVWAGRQHHLNYVQSSRVSDGRCGSRHLRCLYLNVCSHVKA